MISITERLRARHEPVGDGTGKWRPDGLCQEAADTIDALVAALEAVRAKLDPVTCSAECVVLDAALAKAKGKQG